jgi:hypothetical protein
MRNTREDVLALLAGRTEDLKMKYTNDSMGLGVQDGVDSHYEIAASHSGFSDLAILAIEHMRRIGISPSVMRAFTDEVKNLGNRLAFEPLSDDEKLPHDWLSVGCLFSHGINDAGSLYGKEFWNAVTVYHTKSTQD